MTQTSGDDSYKRLPLGFLNEEDRFPTEWQVRDGYAREEWRQTGPDTYEVRNPECIWQLNMEGWTAYNQGATEIINYMKNNFVPTKRRE